MNLSSKSRYALKVLLHLASYRINDSLRGEDIARSQGIPPDYLDQILAKLRKAGLISSTRGRRGVYRLARSSEKISVWDMVKAVESQTHSVKCQNESIGTCYFAAACISGDAWAVIDESIREALSDLRKPI